MRSPLQGLVILAMAASMAQAAPEASSLALETVTTIIVADQRSAPLEQALSYLQRSLERLYGIEVRRADIGEQTNGPVCFLGREAALASKMIREEELDELAPGGYVLAVTGDGIAIAGDDDWATLFGVGAFLEKLGVVWTSSSLNQAAFPVEPLAELAPSTVNHEPAFLFRNGWDAINGNMSSMLGDPRNGATPELFDRKTTGSDLWIDHTAGYLVPKRLFFDAHPEYYAMRKDGNRIAADHFTDHRTPLCLSNPDVARIATERALVWIEKNPDKRFFFITYGDTGFWCQCPECRALDPEEGAYARRLLLWVNTIGRAVETRFPKATLLTFAYAGSDQAPADVAPNPNVWIVAATGAGNIPFWRHSRRDDTERYRKSWEKLDGWLTKAETTLLVCEYIGGSYQPAFLDTTADRYRDYTRKGVKGIAFSYGKPANFPDLWMYLSAKLKWNPELDPVAVAGDYADADLGPGAPGIKRYFQLMHRQYLTTLESGVELVDGYPPAFYTDDYVEQVITCFDEAINAVQDDEKLLAMIQGEKQLFLNDVVRHLPTYAFEPEPLARLKRLLTLQHASASDAGRLNEFLVDLSDFRKTLVDEDPRYQAFLDSWLANSPGMVPVKTAAGWQFPPRLFQSADFGPRLFDANLSHPDFPCPPKLAVAVLGAGKTSRGVPNSTAMRVQFELPEESAGHAAVLNLEGQDGITKWAREALFAETTDIAIRVNGTEVYRGACGFVRGNWSRRDFTIPEGILKRGENTLEIANITVGSRGVFAVCWCLISDAELRIAKE